MNRIAIVGAGDLGKLLAHYLLTTDSGTVAGFFDDTLPRDGKLAAGPLLGPVSEIEIVHRRGAFDQLLVGVGYHHFGFRKSLVERLSKTVPFATFVHPSAAVDPSATLGPGVVVFPGTVIDASVTLEANVLLNLGVVIAHGSRVGAHSYLAPRVSLAGFVTVGECSFLGIGTTVIERRKLCPHTRTGAGAVVVEDLNQPGLYVGIPARRRTEGVGP